jgi:hypothetical protein
MIYIVDYKFIIGEPQQIRGGSMMEQLARKNIPSLSIPDTKEFFIRGGQYRIKHILMSIVQNNQKIVKYIFENLSTKETLDKDFKSTAEAEDYIAHISGKTAELNQIRSNAIKAFEQI